MKFFERLGDEAERSWRARNFDERIFHEVAEGALRQLPPSDHVSPQEIVDWVHDAPRLPHQGDLRDAFGSPPIMVYQGEHFFIQVLFWVDSTTAIHQHGFSGAFHVLSGSSIHSEYRFQEEHRYSERLMTGRLELGQVEQLRAGDVRPIRSGNALIHSLFHLDRPSVSVVLRTINDPFAGPQYVYQRNGVAFDPSYVVEGVTRQVQTLELMRTLAWPGLMDRARRTLEGADAFATFQLLTWLGASASPDDYAELVRGLRSPHTALIERLQLQREERVREQAIVDRRTRVRSAEHRFFLALILNVPSRTQILEMVRKAYPDASPVDTVMRWIAELAETKLDDGRNALDISLDETSLFILRHLVEGATDAQVIGRLREEYEEVDSQQDDVRAFCRAFRASPLFAPLTGA